MTCPKCGAVLDDDSRFCTFCGNPIDESTSQSVTELKQDPVNTSDLSAAASSTQTESGSEKPHKPPVPGGSVGKKIPDILALVVGTIILVVGIWRATTAGTSISSTSFGGDFYTYTYQGIVAISKLLADIESTLGVLIASIGAAVDVWALHNMWIKP